MWNYKYKSTAIFHDVCIQGHWLNVPFKTKIIYLYRYYKYNFICNVKQIGLICVQLNYFSKSCNAVSKMQFLYNAVQWNWYVEVGFYLVVQIIWLVIILIMQFPNNAVWINHIMGGLTVLKNCNGKFVNIWNKSNLTLCIFTIILVILFVFIDRQLVDIMYYVWISCLY